MSDFRVIQGCPCNALLAPYIALLVRDTGATVNSIYRGDDAAALLHRHGKHTQRELFETLPSGVANPPGRSTHELRSDAVSYRGPVGRHLEPWQEGFDVNDGDVPRLIARAKHYGWELFQPYRAGVEFHHLNFRRRPVSRGTVRARIIWLRTRLPRR